ncbi:MAG: alpha-ketoglutarate-dependent dioxygenase AlkB [Betaproteobacteria bacterium]
MSFPQSSPQAELFDNPAPLPHGLVYLQEFITPAQEAKLVESIAPLPFREARFQQYLARRRVVHFHPQSETERYDKGDADTFSSGPLPPFLVTLQQTVATRLAIDPAQFVHALVTEYRPGTPIGWHRDKPIYGVVAGLSLAGWGRMRFRPLDSKAPKDAMVLLDLAPRSLYMMQGAIRWDWQHSLLPTRTLRYSITFRTRA